MRWARVEVFVPERIEVDIRLPKEKKNGDLSRGLQSGQSGNSGWLSKDSVTNLPQ
jgi:hypothetical protein